MTQRQQLVLHVPGTTEELVNALNMILAQLTDRLDQIEGRRSSAEFFSNVDMNSHKITELADGTADTDAVNVGQVTDAVDESGLDHALLDNLNSTDYFHLTQDEYTDFTDGGETVLHTHDHTLLNNLNSTSYYHLTQANHTDLTDGGATALHKHDHGGQDGLGDDDHTQYVLRTQWLQNGFVDTSEFSITWDDGTRTLTISKVGASFRYFHAGTLYTAAVNKTKQIDDTEGIWAFYIDGETLTATNSPSEPDIDSIIENQCIVAYVYWDAANNLGKLFAEPHGYRMSPVTHHYLHDTMGAQYVTGMALGDILADEDGSSDTHAQFSTEAGSFYDEDVKVTTTATIATAGLPIYYFDGSDLRWTTNAGYSFITGGTGRMMFNDAGTQVEVDNTKFALCHIFATNIKTAAGANSTLIAVQGQAQYATLALARDGADAEIYSLTTGDLPLQEILPVATVILQTADAYTNAVNTRIRSTSTGEDYVDWRFSRGGAGTIPVGLGDHGVLSGLGDDDHSQYLLLAGRAGGQIGSGGTAAADVLALKGSAHASGGPITLNTGLNVDVDGDATITKDGSDAILTLASYGAPVAPTIVGNRAGGTLGSPAGAPDGGAMLVLEAYGHDGVSAFHKSGVCSFSTTALHTAAEGGTKFKIQTMKTGGVVLDDRLVIDGLGNILINTTAAAAPTTMEAGVAIKSSVAPTLVGADAVALYEADAAGATGYSWIYGMGEKDVAHALVGAIYKTDAGDPTVSHVSAMVVNTNDDTVKMVCQKGGGATGWNEFLFVEDANFRTYKAIAMCCDNGTSFPTSPTPANAQWFYRTDICTLFLRDTYPATDVWRPIVAFKAIDYYVQQGSSGDGYSSGAGAVNTITEAISLIPPLSYGDASVYISDHDYNEQVTIQGKYFPLGGGLYVIGTKGSARTGTCTSAGVQGTDATQGQYNDTNDCNNDAGKLVYRSNWGYRIVDTVEAGGTADYGLICGVFDAQPQNADTYYVYDWGTSVTGGTAFTVFGMLSTVYFYYLDMTGIYAVGQSSVYVARCKMAFVSANAGSTVELWDTLVSGASWNIVTVGTGCNMQFNRCKVYDNSAGSYVMRMYYNATGDIKSGTVFDGATTANILVNVEMGAKLSCWTDSGGAGRNLFRNATTAINCVQGGGAVNTGTGYNTFTSITNSTAVDAVYSFATA